MRIRTVEPLPEFKFACFAAVFFAFPPCSFPAIGTATTSSVGSMVAPTGRVAERPNDPCRAAPCIPGGRRGKTLVMFGRRRIRPPELDPLVTDRCGRVVGVRTIPPAGPAESKADRQWRRRKDLARTGEMRFQASLRNQFSAFHVTPSSPTRR